MRQAFSGADARPDAASGATPRRRRNRRGTDGAQQGRRRRGGALPGAALALLLPLAGGGCADGSAEMFGNGAAASQAAAAPAPSDPVVAFAADAQPGTEGTVVDPATGQAVRARLVRAYAAASGRECREVALLGPGSAAARGGRLICRGEGEAWAEARPLLRSGVTARP